MYLPRHSNISLLLISSFLITCCASSVYTLPESEREGLTQQTYNHPVDDVFQASLERLNEKGFVINNLDKEIGFITTDWKENTSFGAKLLVGGARAKASINIDSLDVNKSLLRFNMKTQTKTGAFGSWESQKVTKSTAEEAIKPFLEAVESKLNEENL